MRIWPFNRQKQPETLPTEVQEYYESGQKQRRGMALLFAVGTLIATVVIASLLFISGRWVYQKIAGTNNTDTTGESNDSVKNKPAETDTNNPNSSNEAGTKPEENKPSSNQSTTVPSANTGESTPSTGPSATEVPNTGPGPEGLL